ncbi:DUF2271 domain-containing protein [Marinomonas sp. 2405UD66-6]|uniref:DUF2271 domain-containing protein n=1 Tax=Marinomonas sp. 2405UD66-6 TaxID=3391834 RepID=UPI0039C956FB
MRVLLSSYVLAISLGMSSVTSAANVEVAFEIPRIDTERYVFPYVAIWAENGRESKPLLVWHLQKKEDEWLSDLRRWWRKIGRYDDHVDSMTGATKGPGHYTESFEINEWDTFKLYLEVSRQDGGHSLVNTEINTTDSIHHYHIPAEAEIGNVSVTITN